MPELTSPDPPASASNSGHGAVSIVAASDGSPPTAKPRSCAVCRTRKVRCDKQSPCSNCRRANIPCVLPSVTDRRPRWARRLERHNAQVAPVPHVLASGHMQDPAPPSGSSVTPGTMELSNALDRMQKLESLIRELRVQLEQARASGRPDRGNEAGGDDKSAGLPSTSIREKSRGSHDAEYRLTPLSSPDRETSDVDNLQKLGRMVLRDEKHSHYVSSSFWSQVDNEIDQLKRDTLDISLDSSGGSEDELSAENPPRGYHGLLFQHNRQEDNTVDLQRFRPLPSQIPFLLDTFSENINSFMRVVHMPTLSKLTRERRTAGATSTSPSDDALMFSVYYAAIISMDEDEVLASFGSSKADLSAKYRLGLEHALASAEFLAKPNLTLVQALAIFLLLARRHDSPRFVWMMTGLVIRMSQYLGLQRDGSHFGHLRPFEIEMRRRVWGAVCMLDLRASEDEGTEITISLESCDTKAPSNINECDIGPETQETPQERHGITDSTFVRIIAGWTTMMKQMTVLSSSETEDNATRIQDQSRMLQGISAKFEKEYIQHLRPSELAGAECQVVVACARLIMAKMTLIVFLPVLSSSLTAHVSEDIKNRLLVSAIEVAELNHMLNDRQAYRQWRWVYQTHTHWHAIVYLLIDISRRSWSPIVERGWLALHSPWLIPSRLATDKTSRTWIPLRRLMEKARVHRNAEIARLQIDPRGASRLEMEDLQLSSQVDSAVLSANAGEFRERWRQLLHRSDIVSRNIDGVGMSGVDYYDGVAAGASAPIQALHAQQMQSPYLESTIHSKHLYAPSSTNVLDTSAPGHWLWEDAEPFVNGTPMSDQSRAAMDADISWDGDIDWNSWVRSAILQT